jgi:hypothetical protein
VTQVPLDWLDPSPSHLVTIAIIRYNATDKTNYKGSIFINPGRPGGSGIWFIKHLAPYYQSVVGKNQVSHPSPPLFLYLPSLLRADVRKRTSSHSIPAGLAQPYPQSRAGTLLPHPVSPLSFGTSKNRPFLMPILGFSTTHTPTPQRFPDNALLTSASTNIAKADSSVQPV